MSDIPSAIPHPDGSDRIRLASREYSASRDATMAAVKSLSDFLIRGIVPPGLEFRSRQIRAGPFDLIPSIRPE